MTASGTRFRVGLLPTFLLACSTLFAQITTFTDPVIGISDGDTIRVLHDGVSERVRLWGIDRPESGQALYTDEAVHSADRRCRIASRSSNKFCSHAWTTSGIRNHV